MANTGLAEKVVFRGQLPFQEAQGNLSRACLLVLPSLWFEGFPFVIREAYALGVPVAASRLGSIPCLIKEGGTGTLFVAGNPDDLLAKVRQAWESPIELQALREGARREFENKFTSVTSYRKLMEIYGYAIKKRKRIRS